MADQEERKDERKDDAGERKKKVGPSSATRLVAQIRTYVGRLVWVVCVLAALVLAVGALLIALGANQDNGLVKAVLDLADVADLDVFSRSNGIKEFGPPDAATKNALFNWGIGALVWLVVGRIVAGIVRPRS